MDIESLKPTIVLVHGHGALEDSSLRTHGVIHGLKREGYPLKVFTNPLRGVRSTLPACAACWTRSQGP
jgi:predicted alpha/beta-hydrolase family hydrolase